MKEFKNQLQLVIDNLKIQNPTTSHVIIPGEGNIMFSAPHAVDQTREGKIKFQEPETALIALYFNQMFNMPCIIKNANTNDDANYDIDCSYKRDIASYIKEHNIKFVIDLHQMAVKRHQNICIGTGDENNSNLLNLAPYADDILSCFHDLTEEYINDPFKASGEGTMANFISHKLNVPAIQIEINSRLLSDYYNATIEDFTAVINDMKKVVELVKNKIKEEENEDISCK